MTNLSYTAAGQSMDRPERDLMMSLLNALKQRHRDLDVAIDSLIATGTADQLQLRRLKKEKLALKDRIARIEDDFVPDITA
ncbi:MAG: YdcH family protein [Anderseniella sp.]